MPFTGGQLPSITGGPALSGSGDILPEFGPSSIAFNFGANPNLGLVGTNAFTSPIVARSTVNAGTLALVGVAGIGIWLLAKRKR